MIKMIMSGVWVCLVTLGAAWADGTVRYGQQGYITRLHVRYDREHFPEDLALSETKDQEAFQVIYHLRHPFLGKSTCKAGDEYLRGLPARFKEEAQNLATLTGWDYAEIRKKMAENGESASIHVPTLIERLFR